MRKKKTRLCFYEPQGRPDPLGFGCASLGFARGGDTSGAFPLPLEGIHVCGSYEECLKGAGMVSGLERIKAAIVLLNGQGGENGFVRRLSSILKCPVTGGGAAADAVNEADAEVLLITGADYEFEVITENIHSQILGKYRLEPGRCLREVVRIDGEDAAGWLKRKKGEYGISEEDFEHLTFSDENHINAHFRQEGDRIFCGRDIEETMLLRLVEPEEVNRRMQEFYEDEEAVVFGCAGLKGITTGEIRTRGLGLFLFGEVCMTADGAEFGNLMLSKLRVRR